MGRHAAHGLWYYYPLAFLIKTPLPILLPIVYRIVRLGTIPLDRGELMLLLAVIGIPLLASFGTAFGIRQVLLVYPLLFVWLSRVVASDLVPAKV